MKKSVKMISFDGPDGLGKTTQLNAIRQVLEKQGRPLHLTRLLGGDGSDDYQLTLRKLLLHPKFPKNSVELEEQLFAMTDLEGIKSASAFLEAQPGGVVLKDRAIFSHVAYAAAKGMNLKSIAECHAEVIRQEQMINHAHGALNLVFQPDNVDWLLKRIASRSAKTGEAIVERLENRATQEAVVQMSTMISDLTMLQGLSFEVIKVSESDNIAAVTEKVMAVLEKYDI
jgi:thymidylate kinase